jgi:hypothetical protein
MGPSPSAQRCQHDEQHQCGDHCLAEHEAQSTILPRRRRARAASGDTVFDLVIGQSPVLL